MAIVNDVQVGRPGRMFSAAKAAIEARTSVGGDIAYASDTHEFGFYNGTEWKWFAAPGSTDHGALTGLGDDDHAQYLNQTRGDARYALTSLGVTNGNSHDHSGGDGAQIDHGSLAGLGDDDHPQYFNQARGDARYALIGSGGASDHGALTGLGDDDHPQYMSTNLARTILVSHSFSPPFAGTQPFTCSTNAQATVENLSADMLDGLHAGFFSPASHVHTPAAAICRTDNTQSIPDNAWTIIDYDEIVQATAAGSGIITTGTSWRYTAQIAGYYQVDASAMLNAASWTTNQVVALALYRNGAQYRMLGRWDGGLAGGTSTYAFVGGGGLVYLAANDYVDIRMLQRYGSALTIWPDATHNHFSIVLACRTTA